jgi:nucleotide-binding universal stress UspA family protein
MKILLATDGSPSAEGAVQFLANLPLPAGTQVQVVCVVDAFVEALLDQARPGASKHVQRALGFAEAALRRDGVEVSTEVRSGDADHQLLLAARELGADLVVLGSRGLSGWESFLLGSVARNVATHARCTVLVARPPQGPVRQVVVGTDGSVHARHAIDFVGKLPLAADAAVTLAYVVRPLNPMLRTGGADPADTEEAEELLEREQEAASDHLEGSRRRLEAAGKRAILEVRKGDPAKQLLELAG